jgi:hypothetical protein
LQKLLEILGQIFTDQQKKPIIQKVRRKRMYDYWVVTDKTTGRVIAHCGEESDAQMLFKFEPDRRTYRKHRFIVDQVITITSTTDKQLPGQLGLPQGVDQITDKDFKSLPESEGQPLDNLFEVE